MEPKKRLITTTFVDSDIFKLEQFCKRCESLRYDNNKSIAAMRLDWCLENNGQFFLTWDSDNIVSVSGCHPLDLPGHDKVYRGLFRGASLPEYQGWSNVMSKTHMSSIPFFFHLPKQISWAESAGYDKVVVTTNWNNPDGIESMSRSHAVFKLLEKQGLVSCLINKINLFNTEQSVWLLNKEKYSKTREDYEQRHYSK